MPYPGVQATNIWRSPAKLGLDRKTVHKYVERGLEPPAYGARLPRVSKIAPFSRYLRERLVAFPQLTGPRLHRELRDLGYTGSYSIPTNSCATSGRSSPRPGGLPHKKHTSAG